MIGCVSRMGWLACLAIVVTGCTRAAEAGSNAAPLGASWIQWNPDDGEVVVEVGPVDLPQGAGHDGVAQPTPRVGAVPIGGWMRGYELELVDRHGRPVPRRVLHHINLMTPGRRELFSPIMQRIGAAGSETGDVKVPRLIGYRMERGDSLLVSTMFHNPTDQAYEGVRLRVRMKWVREDTWLKPLSVEPFYVDVTPPVGPHSFHLPPGRSEQSWEGVPVVSGRILAVAGHLHDHAVELRFENVTRGKLLWRSSPIRDARGHVVGMPQSFFLWRLGLPLHAGERYRLTAIYDNPTGDVIPDGGMGTLGGVILPERGAAWPRVDRQDPAFVEDMARTLAGEHGAGMTSMHGTGSHAH